MAFHTFSLHVVHNHPCAEVLSLRWLFTASVAIMGHKNDIIKSPGSAPIGPRVVYHRSPVLLLHYFGRGSGFYWETVVFAR